MKYIGLQTQIRKNNFRSILLLLCFPLIILLLFWYCCYISLSATSFDGMSQYIHIQQQNELQSKIIEPYRIKYKHINNEIKKHQDTILNSSDNLNNISESEWDSERSNKKLINDSSLIHHKFIIDSLKQRQANLRDTIKILEKEIQYFNYYSEPEEKHRSIIKMFKKFNIHNYHISDINLYFIEYAPTILLLVAFWFIIAWKSHSEIILKATGSKPMDRKDNIRVYNLVENLCISKGMPVPKLFLIEDESLNAFASGLTEKTYSISLSKGIIDKLNDDELKGVIAHELTHIINRDVRLLIVSIIFVGIFSFLSKAIYLWIKSFRSIRGLKDLGAWIIGIYISIIISILGCIGYLFTMIFRFALSRKREYLADAGAVEMTKNAAALSSALRKISDDPWIEAVKRSDVAQMFIHHPTKKEAKKFNNSFFNGLFGTHPDIKKRIAILDQF